MRDALTLIKVRRAEIARIMDQLQAEDRDLATAEEVFARLAEFPGADAAAPPSQGRARKGGAPRSQRALVIELLGQSDRIWFSSNDIVAEIRRLWGVSIPERSLRPLLSALKREQVVARSGRSVALRERLRDQPSKRGGAQPEV